METTDIIDRRKFDTKDGSEEVTIRLHEHDRLRVITISGMEVTIQDEGDGQPEIVIQDGKPVIYT